MVDIITRWISKHDGYLNMFTLDGGYFTGGESFYELPDLSKSIPGILIHLFILLLIHLFINSFINSFPHSCIH